ncbi:RNA polymerase sigma factor [Chitinophaga sp. CF418]|uniref:RNA polymerase sigma factor n=1 Tax=Chitinophaga sp. CF418 TaxID=1855287 RepID=UPI00091C393C|nr:RNA polymerase sigma factor [Chitinophaga sp. CF418]SHN36054.1 RNA polymerase sigma-70 factor, ECF subfamily [Chitinophaga sp. CF418]
MLHSISYTEKNIFNRVAEGDESAFGKLVELYGPQLEQAVFRAIRNQGPLRDIMQDVFLQIWLGRDKLAGLDDPRTWILKIAYYRSYTWLRNNQVQKNEVVMDDLPPESLSAGNQVEEQTLFNETKRLIDEAIEHLAPQTKRIFQLSRNQQLKIDEIASILGVSPQTVKNTLTKALKQIREHLKQQDVVIPVAILLISFS